MKTTAKILKELREKNGLSIIRLAEKLDISRHSVYKWEMGINIPSNSHLLQLSEIFHVDIDYLISGEEKPEEIYCSNLSSKYQEKLSEVKSFAAITNIAKEFHKELGLDKFLYNQIFRGDTSINPKVTIVTDVRKEWQIHYQNAKYIEIDPTWNYAKTHISPIFCDQLIEKVAADNLQILSFFEDIRVKIAPYFVVIPIHGPCCIATYVISAKDNSRISKQRLHNSIEKLSYFGKLIYEATHRVAKKKAMQHKTSLTEKEISTINHLANGLTIKEIAEKNHITVAAVNARISNAKYKMGAQNCEQLILLAASANVLPHNFGNMRRIKT